MLQYWVIYFIILIIWLKEVLPEDTDGQGIKFLKRIFPFLESAFNYVSNYIYYLSFSIAYCKGTHSIIGALLIFFKNNDFLIYFIPLFDLCTLLLIEVHSQNFLLHIFLLFFLNVIPYINSLFPIIGLINMISGYFVSQNLLVVGLTRLCEFIKFHKRGVVLELVV